MQILLPERRNIQESTNADPLKFYYVPLARSFYIGRFKDAIGLLGGSVDRLLDVGCGSGIFLKELARHCRHLVAFDLHDELAKVRDMAEKEDFAVDLYRGSARELPFEDESMDAVVCMSVLEHMLDLEPVAVEFARVLRPGGVAVIGVPVQNLMTDLMLKTSYLTLDAKLEDEHVSTHRDVLGAFEKAFGKESQRNIPRACPEFLRMYSTARFVKNG
jgi:ubiquinone/menaquinone biosynthesis C-methylase UbiE